MIKKLKFIMLLVVILFTACAKIAPKNKDTVSSKEYKSCRSVCVIKYDKCKAVCKNNCMNCAISSQKSTVQSYKNNKQQKCLQGTGYYIRDLNSFRDPLQCRKVTCNCKADYNICQQSCTGTIKKKLKPERNCLSAC